MKKFIFSALAAIGLLLSPSCSDENEALSGSDNEALVSFNVNLADGISTKASNNTSLDNGTEARKLVVEVYETATASSSAHIYRKETTLTELTGNVDFVLVKDKKYEIIFWAQNQTPNTQIPTSNYYDVSDLRNIKINYNNNLSNLKERDAFLFVAHDFSIDRPTTTEVTLTRPFAQMNFMVPKDDVDKAIEGGMDFSVAETSVTIENVATQLNTLSNKITGDSKSVTFKANAIPFKEKASNLDNETDFLELGEPSKRYYFLATNYFLVDTKGESSTDALANGSATVTATLNIEDESDSYTLVVPNLPVKQNYRTNIYGNLLTTTGMFNVTIKPIINNNPANDRPVVDPAPTPAETTVEVSDLNSLKDAINGTADKIILTGNIALTSENLEISRPVIIDGGNSRFGFTGTETGQIKITAETDKVEITNVTFANNANSIVPMLNASGLKCNFSLTNSVFSDYHNDIPIKVGNAAESTVTVVLEKNTIKANMSGEIALDIDAEGSGLTMRLIDNEFSGSADEYYIIISGTPALTAKGNTFSATGGVKPVKYTTDTSKNDQIAEQLKSGTEVTIDFSN